MSRTIIAIMRSCLEDRSISMKKTSVANTSADLVMLVYLVAVCALMIGFGALSYWFMQPTLLQNAGLAAYQAPARAAILLAVSGEPANEREQLTLESAKQQNREQGLTPLAALAAEAPVAPAFESKGAAQPKPLKPKRSARVQKRTPHEDDARQAWGFAPGWGSTRRADRPSRSFDAHSGG
jgi:hypothetical protein